MHLSIIPPCASISHKNKPNSTKFHQQSTRENSHTNLTDKVEITMHKSFPTRGRYKSCGGNLGELKQRVLAQFRVAEFQHQLLRRRHLLILGRLAQGGAAAAPSHRRGRWRRGPGERGGNGEGRLQVRHLTSNCTAATKHRSPRIVHKSPAQNESGGSESIESNTQLTLSEKPIEFQVDLHSARLASSLRRLTGAEAEAAPTRNGRRNQSHHGRRAAPLQQTLWRSAHYGRIGQAKEEEEATNDGEPPINMQETEGRGTGGGV